jgi:hypothetical protein
MTIEDLNFLGLDLQDKDLKTFLGKGRIIVTQGTRADAVHVEIRPHPTAAPELPYTDPRGYMPLQPSTLCDYSPATVDKDCEEHVKAYGIVQAWGIIPAAAKEQASAEDWNNLGCAYIWSDMSWAEAVDKFTKAAEMSKGPNKTIIEENLAKARKALAYVNHHFDVPVHAFRSLKRVLDTLDTNSVIMDAAIRTRLGRE